MANPGINYSILFDATNVEQLLRATGGEMPGQMKGWLIESSQLTKREMSSEAPAGVGASAGGGIKNNISTDYNFANWTATIGPNKNVPHAVYVEQGSKPHRPPTFKGGSLWQWAEMHGLNVYAVAHSISVKGTKANPFVARTYRTVRPQIQAMFSKGVRDFLRTKHAL